jgi:hypothetical protein
LKVYKYKFNKEELVECKVIDFKILLELVITKYLEHLNNQNQEELHLTEVEDSLFDMEEFHEKTNEILTNYDEKGIEEDSLRMLIKTVKRSKLYTNCSVKYISN